MSTSSFRSVFEDFVSRLDKSTCSAQQRLALLQQFSVSVNSLASSLPPQQADSPSSTSTATNVNSNGNGNGESELNEQAVSTNADGASSVSSVDGLNGSGEKQKEREVESRLERKAVMEFEQVLNERLYALGASESSSRALFQRFDVRLSNFLQPSQFRAAVATAGLLVSDAELKGIINKYDTAKNGSINYDDLFKVLSALRELPSRSHQHDAFAAALVGRPHPTQQQIDELIAIARASDPLSVRMERALKQLRESMYLKSANFHSLFQSLLQLQQQQIDSQGGHVVNADDTRSKRSHTVTISFLASQLPRLGFPAGEVTDEELRASAATYSSSSSSSPSSEGQLTYTEFLAFCLGHQAVEPVSSVPVTFAEQPNLQHALVKLNNSNLRKLFKDLDQDLDGCVTSEELIGALCDHGGLSDSFKRDDRFRDYVETFSLKKKGFFGYAEFLKFANQRLQQAGLKSTGQLAAAHSTPSTLIADGLSASEMMDILINRVRQSNVSVESVLKQFDSNDDGLIEVSEFYQALCELGFSISKSAVDVLFNAMDPNPSTHLLDITDFAKTVANPFRNKTLSVKVRHAPGGESSIPFGNSYGPAYVEDTPRKSSVRVVPTPKREATFDISTQIAPPDEAAASAAAATEARKTVKLLQPTGGLSKIDLSHPDEPSVDRAPRPDTRGDLQGAALANAANNNNNAANIPDAIANEKPKARPPPGGASSINFSGDHGFTPMKPSVSVYSSKDTSKLLSFDPLPPASEPVVNPRPFTAGGRSTLQFSDEPTVQTDAAPSRPAFAVLQSPGGNSSIQFGAAPEKHKPIQRVMASPGGKSTFSLSHDDEATRVPYTPNAVRPQDKLNIDLSFDPAAPPPPDSTPAKRMMKSVNGAIGAETNIVIAHPTRNEAANKPPSASSATSASSSGALPHLGSEVFAADRVLNSYKQQTPSAAVDSALLNRITDAVYAHSQRLRHTFQEFSKGNATTLTAAQFRDGVRSLGITIDDSQVDTIYARFDADLDGAITYSEFVRMMSTKE